MALALPANICGTEECVACQCALADRLLARCGHRVLCSNCLRTLTTNARQRGRRPVCPQCRAEIEESDVQLARYVQIEETCVADAMDVDGVLPYGALLTFRQDGDSEDLNMQFADTQTMARVRQAVVAASRGEVPMVELNAALQNQLTPLEKELAFIELNKDVDLHKTLVKLDASLVRRDRVWSDVARYMIQRTVEGQDREAMLARAAVAAVTDVAEIGLRLSSCAGSSMNCIQAGAANLTANAVVCLIMSSVDVYRWSKGEITGSNLACNVGEHIAGCGCGAAGAYGGAAAGASIGGPIAPATALLGALIGGFLADFIVRSAYRQALKCASGQVVETEAQARQRAITEAANTLGVDYQHDGFALAKSKFRRLILENHPDRNNAPENHEEAARIIAAWQIVRGQYELRNELDDGAGEKEPEALVRLWVMKTRQTVADAWMVARTWFGEMDNSPVHHGQLEMVEQYTVYM